MRAPSDLTQRGLAKKGSEFSGRMFAGTRRKRSTSTRFSEDGSSTQDISEEDAAANIQALWRGKKARKEVAERKRMKEEEARRLEEENAAAFARKVPSHRFYPEDVQMIRYKLLNLFEEPGSSSFAQLLSILILITIVFSILCFMLETMPELRGQVKESDWGFIEKFCTAIFTVEYLIRFWVCDVLLTQTKTEFLRTPMNIFDLLAILPVYLQLLMASIEVPALRVFRAVRLIRLTRIFKLGRYSTGMRVMVEALRNSFQALGVLIFFLCIAVVLFSSCMYYAEQSFCPARGEMSKSDMDEYMAECNMLNNDGTSSYGLCCDEHDSPRDFRSIIDTFWWSFVTMTTVGFGDVYPRTWLGKVVGTFSMLSGILIIALPVAIVGRNFQEVYESYAAAEDKSTGGPGVTAMLKAKAIQVETIPVPTGPMYAMSNRIRTLRLSEALHMGEELRELATLFDEADDHAAQMYRMEMVELYRQDEVARKFEQMFASVLETCGKPPVDTTDKTPAASGVLAKLSLAAAAAS